MSDREREDAKTYREALKAYEKGTRQKREGFWSTLGGAIRDALQIGEGDPVVDAIRATRRPEGLGIDGAVNGTLRAGTPSNLRQGLMDGSWFAQQTGGLALRLGQVPGIWGMSRADAEWLALDAAATGAQFYFTILGAVYAAARTGEVDTVTALAAITRFRVPATAPLRSVRAQAAAVQRYSAARGGTKLLEAAKTQRHHVFPQQFRDFFAKRGVDIDEFTVPLTQGQHLQGVHGTGNALAPGRWNQVWDDFIRANPNATAKEIYQQAGTMMDDFGLSGLPISPY
jgi:hypothetical protein